MAPDVAPENRVSDWQSFTRLEHQDQFLECSGSTRVSPKSILTVPVLTDGTYEPGLRYLGFQPRMRRFLHLLECTCVRISSRASPRTQSSSFRIAIAGNYMAWWFAKGG